MAIPLDEYMRQYGFESQYDGEKNESRWVDPWAGETGGQDPNFRQAIYRRMNAVDDQGRSVWGSKGFTGENNEGAIVNINGQQMYRLGDEAGCRKRPDEGNISVHC